MKRALVLLVTATLTWLLLPIPVRADVAVVDVPIRASSDDAEQRSGSVALSGRDLNLVTDGSTAQTVGLRFTGVNVPKGVMITNAYVQFQVDEVSTATTNLTIAGQAADNAATFTTVAGDVSNRPRTTATATWAPASWPTVNARSEAQRTSSLSSVLQEIVNRQGWATGNPIALIVTGTGTRVAESFEGGAAKAPVLHIEYGSASGSTNTPPAVAAGADQAVTLPSSASLDGTISDSTPTGTLTSTWTETSGPGTVTFGNAAAVDTTASFSAAGTYVLRLTGSDGSASAFDEVTVTAASGTTASLDVPVRVSSDDAEQRSTSVALSGGDLNLVTDGSTVQTVGLRFTGVDVPKGATITNAYVQFQVDEVSTGPVSLTIAGQAAGNAATFSSTAGDISSRAKTAASAAWAPADWPTLDARTAAQRTTSLASVVQEIVNRDDWATGNPVALIVTGTGARVAESFDGGAAKAPVLHIEYGSGSGGTTNQPPTVDAGRDSSVTLPSSATLDGTVTDASPTGTLTSTWSKVAGPGTVTFGNAGAVDTTAGFSAAGTYVLRLTASDGSASAFDEVTVTVIEAPLTAPAPSPDDTPTPADHGFPSCTGGERTVVRPFPEGTVLTSRWGISAPPDDTTYDLSGVASTAFPSTAHPFYLGTGNDGLSAGRRTCLIGGELRDQVSDPPAESWEWYHDFANAACVKAVAYDWYQILGTRCAGIEDGFRPQEPGVNANNARFLIARTYLTNVLDDCLENDYTVGGVVLDSLWEHCYTGVSERPSSSNTSWVSPADETLTLDHMLIGLRSMQHDSGKGTGPNALFKWSTSANKLVIKCSTFFVPQVSVNGTGTMAIPTGTVVDDSACPDNPTTIVWTGGGSYPGDLRGLPIRVTSDRGVWDTAVAGWKSRHGR